MTKQGGAETAASIAYPLGIRGPVAGDGVGFEIDDLVKFFEAHDAEGGTAEGVFDERIFRVEREVEIGHG